MIKRIACTLIYWSITAFWVWLLNYWLFYSMGIVEISFRDVGSFVIFLSGALFGMFCSLVVFVIDYILR